MQINSEKKIKTHFVVRKNESSRVKIDYSEHSIKYIFIEDFLCEIAKTYLMS